MKLRAGVFAGGLAIALPLFVGAYKVWSQNENTDWQPAKNIAPEGLMEQVIEENVNPGFEVQADEMQVLRVFLHNQADPLYLIDSRIADSGTEAESLCGALGCAFFGYVQTDEGYQSVLNIYLDPSLPPDVYLIDSSNVLQNDMPELIVHQLENEQLLQMKLVLSSDRYEVVETQYLPK